MAPLKDRIIGFLGRMLSVVLGIVITFTVQGIQDRKRDRRTVQTALELVRTELVSNREDIKVLAEYFREEKAAAKYLGRHQQDLAKCPKDSVNYHIGIINAEVSVALPHDALELLKMSSLFQKIGDNNLSMKIIRAYDSCQLMVENINRHVSARDAQPEETRAVWLRGHAPDHYMDTSDIDQAVTAINKFLRKR